MTLEIPHSCTLPTCKRPLRLAEFDDLLGLDARARDLTARESSCCSFFDFNVVKYDGREPA